MIASMSSTALANFLNDMRLLKFECQGVTDSLYHNLLFLANCDMQEGRIYYTYALLTYHQLCAVDTPFLCVTAGS